MPELIALTAQPRDSPQKRVATNTVRQFEQQSHKRNAAYWDITTASERINTVSKATGEEPATTDSDELLVFPIDAPEGEQLIQDALRETVRESQTLMTTLRDALPPDPDDLGREIPESTAKELLKDEEFVTAATELSNPFGKPYRVFDLASHASITPVQSSEEITELQNTYDDRRETLYAVKLLGRRK